MQYTNDVRLKALLSYIWPVGLIMFFVGGKNSFVRYNAAQAIVMLAISLALGLIAYIPLPFWGFIQWVINAVMVVVSILCAMNCWNGKTLRVPIIADIADKFINSI